MIVEANDTNYDEQIKGDVVIVDFYATWCGPCKMLAPILEDLVSSKPELKVVKVDVDSSPSLSQTFAIMSIPTLFLYKNGTLVEKKMGFMTKEMFLDWIK